VFIVSAIIINMMILCLDQYPDPTISLPMQEKLNFIFTGIFLVEMLIKFVGYGIRSYFYDPFNTFDCAIVFLSTVDICIAVYSSNVGI
jgi:hypothetical protein